MKKVRVYGQDEWSRRQSLQLIHRIAKLREEGVLNDDEYLTLLNLITAHIVESDVTDIVERFLDNVMSKSSFGVVYG